MCTLDGDGASGFGGSSAVAAAEPCRELVDGVTHCLRLDKASERRIPSIMLFEEGCWARYHGRNGGNPPQKEEGRKVKVKTLLVGV